MNPLTPEDSNSGRLKYLKWYGVVIWMIVFCITILLIIFKQRLLRYNSINQEISENQQEYRNQESENITENSGSINLLNINEQTKDRNEEKEKEFNLHNL